MRQILAAEVALTLLASPTLALWPSKDFEPEPDADSFSRDVDAMQQREMMRDQADQLRQQRLQQFEMQQQIDRLRRPTLPQNPLPGR